MHGNIKFWLNPTDLSDDAQFLIECKLNYAKNKATTARTTQNVEKMIEKPNSPSCPVAAVELYQSKLLVDKDVWLPKPLKPKRDGDDWFSSKEDLGKHTLFDGMNFFSDVANLSKTYTALGRLLLPHSVKED